MGLEDEISDAEIALSKKIYRTKTLASLCVGGAAALFGALCTEVGGYEYFIPQPYFSLTLGVLTSTFLTNLLYQPVNMFSPREFPLALRGLKIGLGLLTKDSAQQRVEHAREKSIHFLEELIPLTRDPLTRRRLQISLAVVRKHYEQAIRSVVPLLEAYEKVRPSAWFWNRIRGAYEYFATRAAGLHRSAEFSLGQSLTYLSRGNLREAGKTFSHACSLDDPLKIPLNCLYGYFLDLQSKRKSGTSQKSQQQWEKTIALVLQDPVLVQRFRRIGDGRNEVLEIDDESILQDTFIFKRNKSPSYLEKEYALNTWLYTLFHGDSTVAQPLGYLSYHDIPVSISRRIKGASLAETLQHTSPSSILEAAIDFLCRFQTTATAEQERSPPGLLSERNYLSFLTEKFARRVTSDTAQQQRLANRFLFLTNLLHNHRRIVIHGDFHPFNIYCSDHAMTALDLEHMTLASAELDLVDLLENHHYSLDQELKEHLLRYAHPRFAGKTSYNEWFSTRYGPVAAYRNLHRIGAVVGSVAMLQPDELKRRKECYRQHALDSLATLRTDHRQLHDSCRELEDIVVAV